MTSLLNDLYHGFLKKVSREEVRQAILERRDEIILAIENEKSGKDDYGIITLQHDLYQKLGGEYSLWLYAKIGKVILNEPLWNLIQEEIKNLH